LCAKAASYKIPAVPVDGMDVVAVSEAARDAVARVRQGASPLFLELRTYRFRPHSMYDPDLYRQAAEVEAWKTRGPIHTFSARLKAEGKLTEDEFLALDTEASAEVARAEAFAEAGTLEPVEDLLKDVYSPAGDHS
ncbi:MAG: pyruvate dehydrogenase (acetyl-transferring) E1 component subunit alpha, partial [Cupriavidus sp.]|nr:pyruvate dehydrogenase (acetyl-transferring) E1 component subunit alpha [Cupriavidus sp.]